MDKKILSDLTYNPKTVFESTNKILECQVNYFPLETSEAILGKPLNDLTVENGKVSSLKVKITFNNSIDFIENFNISQQFKKSTSKNHEV